MPTLRETIKGIADTIREKDGSQETMSLLEMPNKVSALTTSKYGVDMDCLFGDTTSNSSINPPSKSFVFANEDIVEISAEAMCNFAPSTQVTEINLPNLEKVGAGALTNAFVNCSQLSNVYLPKLSNIERPSTTITSTAMQSCFVGCSNLQTVYFGGATSVPNYTYFLPHGVSYPYKVIVPDTLYSSWTSTSGWSASGIVEHIVPLSEYYLTITALEDNCTFGLLQQAPSGYTPYSVSLEFSRDGITWERLIAVNSTFFDRYKKTLQYAGDKAYIRATTINSNNTFCKFISSTNQTAKTRFKIKGAVSVSGNINSLLSKNPDSITSLQNRADYCLASVFRSDLNSEDTGVTSAKNLRFPATTLKNYCYEGMFAQNNYLVEPPEVLPATSTQEGCYAYMFQTCRKITKSPEIKATTLAKGCFQGMFRNASKLEEIKLHYTGDISGGSVPQYAFLSWVDGVASNGTFYYNGSDTTRGSSAIPSSWTIQTF